MVSRLLASWLCGLLTMQAADAPRRAWVATDTLVVLEEPDDAAFATGRLRRGDPVVIRREDPDGWLAIEPPKGAFSWIEKAAIEELGDGWARVVARAAAVRPGSAAARLPGATWTILRQGSEVRLLDRSPLVLRQPEARRRVWYAIDPPPDELRYVRAEGVAGFDAAELADADGSDLPTLTFPIEPEPDRRTLLASERTGPIDPAFATAGPAVDPRALSPAFAAELARDEAGHRAVLVLPMESWRLDQVRQDYRRLLGLAATPQERAVAQSRLDQVDRQEAASQAAREVAAILDRSRRRDAEVQAIHSRLATFARATESPFSARGLLHRSSKILDGQKAYVLIGRDGTAQAYLQVPPGLDAEAFVARRVGVRGDAHYSESLRSRVIWVRDLEALDEAP